MPKVFSKIQAGDRVYVYAPENTTVFRHPGEATAAILNAKTLKCDNLGFALKQTVYVMSVEDMDVDKYVILIIDQNVKSIQWHIGKGLSIDKKENVGCQFIICGIGDFPKELEIEDCTFIKSDKISDELIKICFTGQEKKYGEENTN